MCHRQHGADCDRKNGKREDGAAYGKAALIFGHGAVSWLRANEGERAESGFVMIDSPFSHLQIALATIARVSSGDQFSSRA